jgi:peptidoglycan/LPS O-acetylase OafA/YrhL
MQKAPSRQAGKPTGLLQGAALLTAILAIYLGAVLGPRGSRFIGSPWIALIGGACYSIYLVHVPLMQVYGEIVRRIWIPGNLFGVWALFSLSILASIVAGLIFYALVERPTMKHDWPRVLWERLTARRRPT